MPQFEITFELFLIKLIEIFSNIYLLNSVLYQKISKSKYLIATFLCTLIYLSLLYILGDKLKIIIGFISIVSVMTYILKTNVYKVALAYVVTSIIILLLDTLCVIIVYLAFGKTNFDNVTTLSSYYLTMTLLILLTFIASFAIKYFKLTFTKLNSDNTHLGIAFNSLLTLLFVLPGLIIIVSYIDNQPLSINIVILNLITMFAMLVLSIFNSQKRYNLLLSQQEVECQKSYITILQSLVDNLRTFKHDYNNTLSTLAGCAQLDDIKSLKKVLKGVLDESKKISTLDKLNPDTIKNPTIYGLITSKYQQCEKNNVNMNFEIFSELKNLEIRTFDLTRILGILLDNALEAASGSKNKKVNLYISEIKNKVIIEISNTFSKTELSVDKMFEKGTSSKGENRGLGLYKVKEIIKRYSTVALKTCIDNEMFLQKLTIEKSP